MLPDYNVPPGVDIWAVRNRSATEEKEIARLRWGLVPSWAKDPKIGNRMINARSETVAEKPAFRSSFKKRRCLIPADGFYEWKRDGTSRTPYYIHLKDQRPFAMAGLWEQWIGPEQEMLESCTILTTSPNQLMERLHDRMPVILPQDQMSRWLEPSTSATELQAMTSPYPTEDMTAYPVSSLVNSPRNNSPECLERQEILEQKELF